MMTVAEKEAAEKAQRARALYDEVIAAGQVPQVGMPPAPSALSASYLEETGAE